MDTLNEYLNPLMRLGRTRYSSRLPLVASMAVVLLFEIYTQLTTVNTGGLGTSSIPLFVGLVVYFAFRDGILGGSIATLISMLYYTYKVHTLRARGQALENAENEIVILGLVFLFLATTIGWLREKIDRLVQAGRAGERRLKTIVEQLPVGLVIRNNKGVVETMNRQAAKIFNGRTKQMLELLAKVTNSEKPVINREILMKRTDGRQAYIQVNSVPILNDDNSVIGSAAIFNDLTKIKEIEKRKDDFVNMASHELKTPITSMKLYLDLLSENEEKLEPGQKQIVNSLRLQTRRLQRLTNDLVDVSRIQTGKFTFEKKKVDLLKLVEETLADMDGAMPNRKINLPKKQPVTTMADQFRIYQVLSNLITNALKYSPPTAPVNVTLEKKGKDAVISVQDFGVGIAKDQQKKIFQRLYQVKTDTQYTFPGMGMGLYIAREIVRRHQGRIWVESIKGKGSTFYFSLPIIADDKASI